MTITTKRKILFFVPAFPVLTETFIEGEVRKLAERGNLDIWVLALEGDKNNLPDILKAKVVYEKLSFWSAFLGILFGVARLEKVLEASILINSADKKLSRKIFLIIKYLGYSRIISKIKPDFLLAHFFSEPSTLGMFASKVLSIPYGISAHARDVTVTAECSTQKISTAKFILICNKNAQKVLIEKSGNSFTNNIILQYHGIDVKTISEKTKKALDKPDKPLIVSIGRLTEKKGHEYLIEASKILKERDVAHLIYIIGPGPLYKDLTDKINNLGLNEEIKILGNGKGLSPSETLSRLKNASVGVFSGIKTDQGDVDGVPNVLLEYAALNIPIVSTDAGGASEFVENEKTGLSVPQKNSYLLADAIEKLLFDKELSLTIATNAYKKVKEDFDINKNIVELERLLS